MSETQTPSLNNGSLPDQPPIYEGDEYGVGGIPDLLDQTQEYDSELYDKADETNNPAEVNSFGEKLKTAYFEGRSVLSDLSAALHEKRASNLERKKALYSDIGALVLRGQEVTTTLSNGEEPKAKLGEKLKLWRAKRKANKLIDTRADVAIARNYNIDGKYGDRRLQKAEYKYNKGVDKLESSVLGAKKQKKLEKKINEAKYKAAKKKASSSRYNQQAEQMRSDYDEYSETRDYEDIAPFYIPPSDNQDQLPFRLVDSDEDLDEPTNETGAVTGNESNDTETTERSAQDQLDRNDAEEVATNESESKEEDELSKLNLEKGQVTRILNAIGEIEDGWIIHGFDFKSGKFVVRKPTNDGSGRMKQRFIASENVVKKDK